MFSRLLRLPDLVDVDLDSEDRINQHAAVLARKPMLRDIISEFHHLLHALDRRYFGDTPGLRIELGAGIAPVRNAYPDVLATDVVPGRHLDRILDAQAMELSDGSVRVLFGLNSFHHFPEPERFFAEATRVIRPGGGIVLIEPYYGPCASVLLKRIFASEGFDKTMKGWSAPMTGPMSGTNQALSYIIFKRDLVEFRQRFPSLDLAHEEPLRNYLRYVLSGGLNFRQLAPDALVPAVKRLEALTHPLRRFLALFHVVVIRRT